MRIKALRALVDRLGSPDLTLIEAKALRRRLLDLMRRGEDDAGAGRHTAPPAAAPAIPGEDQPHRSPAPGCRDYAA